MEIFGCFSLHYIKNSDLRNWHLSRDYCFGGLKGLKVFKSLLNRTGLNRRAGTKSVKSTNSQ